MACVKLGSHLLALSVTPLGVGVPDYRTYIYSVEKRVPFVNPLYKEHYNLYIALVLGSILLVDNVLFLFYTSSSSLTNQSFPGVQKVSKKPHGCPKIRKRENNKLLFLLRKVTSMRVSRDQIINGRVTNGYDYKNQAWVVDGKYMDCGHPQTMNCNCYGRLHKNQETTGTVCVACESIYDVQDYYGDPMCVQCIEETRENERCWYGR